MKIIGKPQAIDQNETADDTANICINLFHNTRATNVTLQEKEIAHQIPTRGDSSRPNSIFNLASQGLHLRPALYKYKRNTSQRILYADSNGGIYTRARCIKPEL